MNLADREEMRAVAGEYVLGVLSAEEIDEVENALAGDRALRDEVDFWEERLIGLTQIPRPIAPSPALWRRIERDLPPQPAAMADMVPLRRAGLWHSLPFWRAASAALMAATILLAVLVLRPMPPGERADFTAILQAQDKSVAFLVEVDARRAVSLTPLASVSVPASQSLELWALKDANDRPRSLGVVAADRRSLIAPSSLPEVVPGQLFLISLEPAGGSPTGLPTGPVLYGGPLVAMR